MMEEFKKFAISGNVLDLAVGVVVGGAFGKITTSLVENIIMPPIGILTNGIDFQNLFINLGSKPVETLEAAKKAGIPVLAYGAFIQACVEFFIIAFSIFIVVQQINKLRTKPASEPAK
jgi:large conductance mechanosensitive channel